MKFKIKKSAQFLKTGIPTKGDKKTISRIGIDYINNYSRLNKYRIELDPNTIDSEIDNNNKFLNHLYSKNPLTIAKAIDIKWDILIYEEKKKQLQELKVSIPSLQK